MITKADLARRWKVSHQYISKLVAKGMPLDSFEAASLWREAHASSKASTNPRQIAKQLAEEESEVSATASRRRKKYFKPRRKGADFPTDASLDDALFAAIQASDEAFRLLQEAMIEGKDSQISARLSVHNKALEAQFLAERLYREELERRRVLIPLAEAQDIARKGYEVILARLMAHPQNVAPRCNPQDPHHAMKILEEAVAAIIEDARQAFAVPENENNCSQNK
jgi:hypothetical protein